MIHLTLSRQDRSQLNQGRWFERGGPLCNTGDGHHQAIGPFSDWGRPKWPFVEAKVSCPHCLKQLQDDNVRAILGLERKPK